MRLRRIRLMSCFAALGLLVFLPASAGAMQMDHGGQGAAVSIQFAAFAPTTTSVLAGDTVMWTNDASRQHTVTADDGSFDSGTLAANGHFARVFDAPGTYAYHCRLHPYIRGEIDVHALLLDRPTQPGAPGHPYPLSGRAALAAGTPVEIQYDDGSGSWQPVADAAVGSDGSFTAQVTPTASGNYRAVAGGQQSPAVDLLVLNRTVTIRRSGRRLIATVTPASPGATVVLQLYLKERFGWWPVAQRKLGKDSRVVFTPRFGRRVSARVVLTLSDGATVVAKSALVRMTH
jgi:plastocyanin